MACLFDIAIQIVCEKVMKVCGKAITTAYQRSGIKRYAKKFGKASFATDYMKKPGIKALSDVAAPIADQANKYMRKIAEASKALEKYKVVAKKFDIGNKFKFVASEADDKLDDIAKKAKLDEELADFVTNFRKLSEPRSLMSSRGKRNTTARCQRPAWLNMLNDTNRLSSDSETSG